MKFFIHTSLMFSLIAYAVARDPGSGSNTTLGGPGPATPDAASQDTSVMGGGTPGNEGVKLKDKKVEKTLESQRKREHSSKKNK